MPPSSYRKGELVKCQVCGKETYRPQSLLRRKYCGNKCKGEAARARRINKEDGTARCSRCKQWKEIGLFVRGPNGLPHSHCKRCNSDWFAERRGAAPERRRPYREFFSLTDEQRRAKKRERNRRQHLMRRAAGKAPHRFEIGKLMCLQDAKCAYCKTHLSGPYHIDHKTPVSRGGTNDISNLHITCPRCNMQKHNMTHEEFLASKKRKVVSW